MDPRFGAVYDSVPHSADDLAVIRGIETREAAGLNRLGIYFFEQIAGWTEFQAAAVADALGMPASRISHDRWTAQAQALVPSVDSEPFVAAAEVDPQQHHLSGLPASGTRTITVLVCALMAGCFVVWWLNRRAQIPMTGVLAAEITSLRVPADSRLLNTHVKAGDEVFSGQTLLTLEKTEHMQQIVRQTQQVHQLAEKLQQANSRAALDLQWRSQQLDQEISDTERRARLLQNLISPSSDQLGVLPSSEAALSSGSGPLQSVSSPREVTASRIDRVNALLFMSGSSGATTLKSISSLTAPIMTARLPRRGDAWSVDSEVLRLEAETIRTRLQRLTQLRSELPAQVQLAAGVEHLRIRHRDAQKRLKLMESLSRETTVLCPAYGIIGQMRFQIGDRMKRDDVMVKILHRDRRFVIVHPPADQVAELQPGVRVAVLFPGRDDCQGVVADLPMIAGSTAADGTTVTAVRVESTGRNWPDLPVGSTVEVRIQ